MKKQLLPLLCILSLIFVSCSKEDLGPQLRKQTEDRIMGKWNVEKTLIEEYFHSRLANSEEHQGTAEDYYFFKPLMNVEIGAAPTAVQEVEFSVLNPYQVTIGDNHWWIGELSQSTLMLYIDRNVVENNKRYVTKIFLKK